MKSSRQAVEISSEVRRRFVLGRQGLWPGRRWSGKSGSETAMVALESLQIDPVSVVAQSHDIVMWGRVHDYRPEFVHELAYQERRFFDYGTHLHFFPMEDLPYWRSVMKRRIFGDRWKTFASENGQLLNAVRQLVATSGPIRSREIEGKKVNSYRSGKDTGVALYYLWITGELMTHHRHGRERVYDLAENIAPDVLLQDRPWTDTVEHFIRKGVSQLTLFDERDFRAMAKVIADGHLGPDETAEVFERLLYNGDLRAVILSDGNAKEYGPLYCRSSDLDLLHHLCAGTVPEEWGGESSNGPGVVFLSPLDYVSARGRARTLFDFSYVWEIYKPAHTREYGPYTLPVLYGDRPVARIDFRLDRKSRALVCNGFWVEAWFRPDDEFHTAFSAGLADFAGFHGSDPVPAPDMVTNLRGGNRKAFSRAMRSARDSVRQRK